MKNDKTEENEKTEEAMNDPYSAGPGKMVRIEQKINEHTVEMNTEASVRRVLTPVLWMIHEGKFDSMTTS